MLSTASEPVDTFFDKVMVMVEDERVRANRLALLQTLVEGIFHHRRFLRDRDRRQRIQRIFETIKDEHSLWRRKLSPKPALRPPKRIQPPSMCIFFGGGKADGNGKMKDDLGGKGAGLAEMTNAGLPVPPGFTIQTEACREYMRTNGVSDEVERQMDAALKQLEELQGQKLGKGENPLLVSVRSGAKFSMPGMMDTILNLGLNDQSVEALAKRSNNPRFAYDSYRRLIQMFGNVVLESRSTRSTKCSTPRRSRRKPSSTPTSTPRR